MLMDIQQTFSDAQVLTATANSTNILDESSSRNLGGGEPIFLVADITAISGTSPTLTIALHGADDSGFSTNDITIASVTPTLVSGTAYGFVRFGIPSYGLTPKRYYRLVYTVGGTTPSITITAGLVLDQQTAGFV